MEYIKIILSFIGGAGLLKLIEFIISYRAEKRLTLARATKETAEAKNLKAQTESKIIENWMQWANALETKVKELEKKVDELTEAEKKKDKTLREYRQENELLKKKLEGFEKKVEDLCRENISLKEQLRNYMKNSNETDG